MTSFLLVYEKYERAGPGRDSWLPLLQHQALVAVARAVLSDAGFETPALSDHQLIVPGNLDILPLLAMTARDFAAFAEPEGIERPRAPFIVYDDGSWDFDSEDMGEMRHLLHPAWFRRLNQPLRQTVVELRPEVCVIMGDPRRAADRIATLPHEFRRIVHFDHLRPSDAIAPAALAGEVIAADRILQETIEAASRDDREAGAAGMSMWQTLIRDGDAPDLEPFVAFGPAIEMVTLIGDG